MEHFYCRFLLYLLCMKTTGMTYRHPALCNYVNYEISQYIQEPYKTYILDDKKFLSYIKFEKKLFVREDLDLIKRFTLKVPAEALYFEKQVENFSEIEPLDLQENSGADIDDWDPLRFAPSETSYSSVVASDRVESIGDMNDIKLELTSREYPKNISQVEEQDKAVLDFVLNEYEYN